MMRFDLSRWIVALVLLFAFHSSASAACDPHYLPKGKANNEWYCANESDTVVVFVHGLHSDSLTAWKSLTEEGGKATYWPGLVLSDPSLKAPSVYLAGFYTEIGGVEYSMTDAANELYTFLSTPSGAQGAVLSKKNILFVAHSLGGIIVREVLVRHAQALAGKRIGLLLVASPSAGSKYAQFLATAASVTRQRLVEELATKSPFLRRLEDDFRRLIVERQLVGSELVENQFVDLGGVDAGMLSEIKRQVGWVLATVYSDRIVEPESAARYFPNPIVVPKSDHFTIARPTGINDLAHRELVQVFNRMTASAAPACEPPPGFTLELNLAQTTGAEAVPEAISDEWKASLPLLRLWRTRRDGSILPALADQASRDPLTGRHSFTPRSSFPCPGDAFRGKVSAVPLTSFTQHGPPSFTELCFRRSERNAGERFAGLQCTEGQGCKPDGESPGMAEPCVTTGWRWPSLVGSAFAQDAAAGSQHWVAPSLATLVSLPASQRPGYAEFTVRSGAISGIEGADHVSLALAVNGVPIYFDGAPPHSEVQTFNSADGVRLTFGVENLGFTGGRDGYEILDLEIRFWKGEEVLKTAHLKRSYVSYRHAPSKKITDAASGEVYTWSGHYRPSQIQNRYEVIVATAPSSKGIADIRDAFDKHGKRYEKKPVVGIIRPGRADNPVYGMTFGVRLPTGQVSSSFAESDAKAICRWLLKEPGLPGWMRDKAYLYEFPAETITDTADRGVARENCRHI